MDEQAVTLRQLIVGNLEQSRTNEILVEKIGGLESDEATDSSKNEEEPRGIRRELELTFQRQKNLHNHLQKLLYQLSRDVEKGR